MQLYDILLSIINITFSAGGVLQGITMLLIVSTARYMPRLPRWVAVLIGLAGLLTGSKGVIELAAGADLGPLGLLAGIILSIALCSIAVLYSTSFCGRIAKLRVAESQISLLTISPHCYKIDRIKTK